ncbi:hypothetical protein RchiOBHm_Chr2g0126761 [Rosa chinensis]|uniref:Uncharacterized protein n=1 Tax=Rosa chinensis TaxID=74649 RepID=A0A2P6RTZ2_ROSCH|nr:hypothetical protein RchiOBHm_Chr2g0126761 [Rosa chinensis]
MAEFQKDHRGTIWRWIIKALSMKKEHQFKSLLPPLFQLEHLGNLLKQFSSKWFILRLFAACCQFSEWLPETSTMDVGC